MKQGMHPKYAPVTINCVGCGTKIETRSTRTKDFSIDVCSHCHPFYTGRQKFVDSAGRVERFQKKWAAKDSKKPAAESAAPAAAAAPVTAASSETAAHVAHAAPVAHAAAEAK